MEQSVCMVILYKTVLGFWQSPTTWGELKNCPIYRHGRMCLYGRHCTLAVQPTSAYLHATNPRGHSVRTWASICVEQKAQDIKENPQLNNNKYRITQTLAAELNCC